MVADLVAEFCRQHTVFELDVDLNINGCPQIGHFIPKKSSLSQLQQRIEDIMSSQVFQEEVLIAGKSRFKGVYSDSLSNLVGQEFTPVYAKQAIAHSLTGIYIVGYYGDDGSEVIFNVLKRLLPKNNLRQTPWSSCMPQNKDYVPLHAFTVVAEIGHRLILEDFSTIGEAVSAEIAANVMMISSKGRYKKLFVEIDEDN